MKRLDYSIVIATRNRPAALRLSIPRMLKQSRPPSQLIVVDSSDTHSETVKAVEESVGDGSLNLTILKTERGLTRQRNLGLAHVVHPIVFFPDDDSIWFPETAFAQLDVYERDEQMRISAVCAAESRVPPPDWESEAAKRAYRTNGRQWIHQKIGGLRTKIEMKAFPDPAKLAGRRKWPPANELPSWFAENDVVLVEYMTGFRMSFRSDVIRRFKFDEALSQYSLCEDIDASFGAWRHGMVVAAKKALVYHFRAPERRENGERYGATQILNKAYVVSKTGDAGERFSVEMMKYFKYKVFLYSLAKSDSYGALRYAAAKRSLPSVERLLCSSENSLADSYLKEMERVLNSDKRQSVNEDQNT